VIKDERIYPERLQPNRANKKRVTIQNEKKGKDYMTAKLTRDQIKIDPELRDFLLPLNQEENDRLRGSLMADGCLSPLIVDSITGTLLDGHNRYRICTEKNIPFEIKEISMSKKEQQKQFILINQLARRNLTPERMKYYRAMLYESVKGEAGFEEGHEFKGNQHAKSKNVVGYQNDTPPHLPKKAAKKVAELTNSSSATVNRDVKEIKAMKEAGKLDEYTAGKLSKEEKKKILEAAKPVRKQTKAEADEEAELMAENPGMRKDEKANKKFQQSNGLGIAATAISVLGRISKTDTQRVEGFENVISYCIDRLGDKEKVNSIITAIAKSKLTNTERADLVSRIIGEIKPPQAKRVKEKVEVNQQSVGAPKPEPSKAPEKKSPRITSWSYNILYSYFTNSRKSKQRIDNLEKSLQKEGCKSPIIIKTRDGKSPCIIDGEERKKICEKLGIHYQIQEMYFESDAHVLVFIAKNEISELEAIGDKAELKKYHQHLKDSCKETRTDHKLFMEYVSK
jgi:hypothetical protein